MILKLWAAAVGASMIVDRLRPIPTNGPTYFARILFIAVAWYGVFWGLGL